MNANSLKYGLAALASIICGSAHAAFIETVQEVGTSVVATGSGTIDTTDLSATGVGTYPTYMAPYSGTIITGPTGNNQVQPYVGISGPANFGQGGNSFPTTGTGDLAGILYADNVIVPVGYSSGSPLADTATYNGASFSSMGVTPGTYQWTWGAGTDADSFTLQIGTVPAPVIGHGLPVLLAVGGLLFGAKLLERRKNSS